MKTFYVLDLGMYGPTEWEFNVPTKARSASEAARNRAGEWDEDGDDGRRFEVAVAEQPDGSDAVKYVGHCSITVEYKIDDEAPFKVEAPESDE